MQKGQQTRVLHAIKDQITQSSFILVICDSKNPENGLIVKQIQSSTSHEIFQVEGAIKIRDDMIIQTLNISCIQASDRFLIPKQEYRRILNEIYRDNDENNRDDRQESNSQSSSSQESDGDDNSEEDSVYANRPLKIEERYQHDSDNAKSQRKGRGRPKGSKNKKTLIKQEHNRHGSNQKNMLLHSILSGKIKRGKGRPKGSKNKPKMPNSFVKKQYDQNAPFIGKRGKGRPKGSKNKIKVAQQMTITQQNKIKRGRGRPPGARNRLPSSPQISSIKQHQSQSEQKFEWERIDKQIIDDMYCCNQCDQRRRRGQILQGKKYFQIEIQNLQDVFCDYGLENKKNLALQIIQQNDQQRLQLLLSKVDSHEILFRPPWPVENFTDKTRFQARTKKDYLSQTGKQGVYVMLHDCNFKKVVWWKRIGVKRIIQNIAAEQQCHITLQKLFNESEQLKGQIYGLFPHILGCGNNYMAQKILKDMLQTPASNKYNYSEEHYDLLTGNLMRLNQYKKYKLIKPNQGNNYCSPIHCAAVTSNPQFLEKLLQIFTDVIHVQDSIYRKPIHYASASKNIANLRALVQSGAELRQFDKIRMTPLMIACFYGAAQNTEYILQKVREHSYINFRSDQGYSALHYAILNNHEECVDLLLNDPYVKYDCSQTKQLPDVFHIVSWTGNTSILEKLLDKWSMYLSNSFDKFKKTPAMYAIRNHNNDTLYKLLVSGCRPFRSDTTLNTLLHYAAAFGNVEAIMILLQSKMVQVKNKRNYYPWQYAVMKGHLGCAKMLEDETLQFKQDPLYFLLTCIRGTKEYFDCVEYVANQRFTTNIKYQDPITGNTYLHLVCGMNEEEYVKQRSIQTFMDEQQIRQQFCKLQNHLIDFFIEKGLHGYTQNKKKQSPLKQCIENVNLIGIQKLLTGKISFDLQSAQGSTIMHRLSNLACRGISQIQFVEQKLKQATVNDLRINLKNFDQLGFDFLLYFIKNFVQTIKQTYKKWVKKYLKQKLSQKQAEKAAFKYFVEFQGKFMKLVSYLIEQGCDVNRQVTDKKNQNSQNYQKWGIQHFLMKFPSLKLIEFFTQNKHKIRYFNAQNNYGMTALHLFCKNIKSGNLLETQQFELPDNYQAQKILQYLLANGLNPNTTDFDKSLPILYAALNHQYKFISILLRHKSEINQVNSKNQVPLIEIIKNHRSYRIEEIQNLLKRGAKPSFQDMQKRNSLHHLVRFSTNFDSSPELCRLLLDHNVKINSLDKYNRSPIFYCFDPDDEDILQNDKVQLLQVLINLPDINLNLLDVFTRSIVHYACRKNYFFSIMYLLDRNINIESMDHESNTPLAICLKQRNLDQAAFIIRKGVRYGFVNTQIKNQDNTSKIQKMSYFGYAIKNLSVGICFMLLDYGYPIQKALEEVSNEAFKEVLKKKYIK